MSRTSATQPPSQLRLWSDSEELSSSSAGPRARTTRSLESEREWMATMVACSSSSLGWLAAYGPVGWSWKMSPASCRQEEDGTLVPSSGRWGTAGFGTPSGFSTAVISECPNGAAASSLSHILEHGEHLQRYSLSPRACAGILRRAEKRGRILPAPLAAALEAVAGRPTSSG